MGGYDTSIEIDSSLRSAAVNASGQPGYWLRYFSPSPAATLITTHPYAETRNIWDSKGPHLGPITEPNQGDLGQDYASGQSHAQTFANALVSLWETIKPLNTPSSGV